MRIDRLTKRGPDWLERTQAELDTYLHWAAWLRAHAADPGWRLDVIRREASEPYMCWSRSAGWRAGDPRWRVHTVDTTSQPVQQVASGLAAWVARERELLRSGRHPLTGAALKQGPAGVDPGITCRCRRSTSGGATRGYG